MIPKHPWACAVLAILSPAFGRIARWMGSKGEAEPRSRAFPGGSRRRAQRGYTLLEMLIVAAVITAMVAMVLPAMRRPLAKSELRDAAGQLRIELAKARLKAIESGTLLMFRYQPGTGRFLLESPSPSDTAADDDVVLVAEDAEFTDRHTARELAHEVVFLDPDAEPLPPAAGFAVTNGLQPIAGIPEDLPLLDGQEWSKPVFFYPTGRTSSARLRLVGQHDYFVDVMLRGLTGSVKLGELRRPQPMEVTP